MDIEKDDFLTKIKPVFHNQANNLNCSYYTQVICNALRKILKECMAVNPDNMQRDQFLALLPLVTATKCCELPGTMSVFALARERAGAFKFFYDMLSGWLLSGRRLNVQLIYSADFCLPNLGKEVYTLCEIMIQVKDQAELDQILGRLPGMEVELQMGLASSQYARRILEIKGFSADEKTALIQEHIAYLIDRMPKDFDQDVLTEMQHVLLMCRKEFKAARECRHLSRIIAIHYLFRKGLRDSIKGDSEKRYVSLKLFKARLKQGDGQKSVLAVLVGVNFFRDKEVFDKIHLLKAIQSYIPTAVPIENSFFANRRGSESICTLYLELEKSDRKEFTAAEIKRLRQELPAGLKDRIRHLLNPVFMPRNEEEIMRNILSLSSQIKYLRDIPQVFISFDEQTHAHVFFTIILVRVAKPQNLSIQEMFKASDTCLEYIHDRCQHAGSLRQKHKKEATVFRVKLAKDQFLRADHTIDINKARQTVVSELYHIIGDIRDFNGGMMSKQNEVLSELKNLLQKEVKYSDLLLENFFYSLTPVIMRNVLEPEALKTLFLMLLDAIESRFFERESYALKIVTDPQFVFAMIKAEERSVKEEIGKALSKLHLHSSQLANAYVSIYDIIYLGYIYRSDDPAKQRQFAQVVTQSLAAWQSKRSAVTPPPHVLLSPEIGRKREQKDDSDGQFHRSEVIEFIGNIEQA